MNWHGLDIEEVLASFNVDGKRGLNLDQYTQQKKTVWG